MFQLLPPLLFPLLDLFAVILPSHLLLLLLPLQLLQQHPPLLFLRGYLLQKSSLLSLVSLKLFLFFPLLLTFIIPNSAFDFNSILLLHLELLLQLRFMLIHLTLSIIINLIEEIYSSLFSFLPLLLLFLFDFNALGFNQFV